jgi:hypothetical protein
VQKPHHILTTWTEPWGYIKVVSATSHNTYATYPLLSFYLRCSLEGYTVGTTVGFRVEIVEALAPQSSLPQRTKVPAVAYEHLFRLPFRGCSYYHTPPPPRTQRKGRGYYWCKIPQYRGSPITAQAFGYDRLPLAANSWRTIHPILDKGPTTPG